MTNPNAEKFCPARDNPCATAVACELAWCRRLPQRPIHGLPHHNQPALHFVGMDAERYDRAKIIFGEPDFAHRVWDLRAAAEIMPGDVAVFGGRYNPRTRRPDTHGMTARNRTIRQPTNEPNQNCGQTRVSH